MEKPEQERQSRNRWASCGSRIPRWWPKRGGDCGFEKTVDDVMVSKIYKCEEVVDGSVQNEVDGHREKRVIQQCVQNVGGKINSGKMLPKPGFGG